MSLGEEQLLYLAREFAHGLQWLQASFAAAMGHGPPVWVACKELVVYRVTIMILLFVVVKNCVYKAIAARQAPAPIAEGRRIEADMVARAVPVAQVLTSTNLRQRGINTG
jgi:hypothetical protein